MFILYVLRFFYNIDKYIVFKMFFLKLISFVKSCIYVCDDFMKVCINYYK